MRRVGTPRRCATTSARVRGRALRRPTSDPDHGREWLFEEGHQLGWSSPPVLGDGLEGGELPGGGGVSGLELPSIGWQLFILGSSQSDSTAFPSLLDTYATRL